MATGVHPFERMQAAARSASFFLEDFTHHGEHRSQVPLDTLKTGHRVAHKPVLDLRDYVVHQVEPPAAVWRGMHLKWGMLLNDVLGDCGPAMAIHGDMAFHHDAKTPVPAWGPADAEKFYEAVGGYVPGDPSTDQGVDNNVLVHKWQTVGMRCHASGFVSRIAGSVFVPPEDTDLVKLAIWEFVARFTAFGLPITAQHQQGTWAVVSDGNPADAKLGSWGYHDVPEIGYDVNKVGLVTWGMPWAASWSFETLYNVQSFVVITREQTNLQGISPAGIDWTKLNSDLSKLPAVPGS